MMFPGYWVSFWVVALRIVDEEELSGLICIRYSVSEVTTSPTTLRTSYSRYAVPSVFTIGGPTQHSTSMVVPKPFVTVDGGIGYISPFIDTDGNPTLVASVMITAPSPRTAIWGALQRYVMVPLPVFTPAANSCHKTCPVGPRSETVMGLPEGQVVTISPPEPSGTAELFSTAGI